MNIVRLQLVLVFALSSACRGNAPRAAPPTAPLAWAPPYARGVVDLDLVALRRSPALARWLRAQGGGDCAARLSTKVRRLVVVSLDGGAESLGLVLAGEITPTEVLACARQRGSSSTAREVTHRGVRFTRIADPRGEAEVDVIAQGVALVGPPWVTRALLDAGLSHAEGHGETAALRGHWDALPEADARGAWLPGRALRESLGVDAVRASATANDSVTLTVTAVAPSEEAALALAQRWVQWRATTAPTLQHAALRGLVEGLRLRADGRAVSATLSLDGPTLTALGSTLGALAAGL